MGDESDPGRFFAELEERAREERGRVEAEAAHHVSRVKAEADHEVQLITARARLALRRELAVEGRRLVGEARLQARLERLRVKRALLAEVFEAASAAIGRLRAGDGYGAALEALAAEARAAIGEPCSVEVRAGDASVTAAAADGRRRADNGLATRLGAVRDQAEPDVARILFGARRSTDRRAPGAGASP